MAVVTSEHITKTECVGDIRRITANGFTEAGGALYLAYINMDNHAVVWTSNDNGQSWSELWDFGVRVGITIMHTLSADVCVTYWDSQVYVAYNGSEISRGSVTSTGYPVQILNAVTVYPLLIITTTSDGYYSGTQTVRVDVTPTFGPDQIGSYTNNGIGGGADSVFGYSKDGHSVCLTAYIAPSIDYANSTTAWYLPLTGTGAVAVARNYGGGGDLSTYTGDANTAWSGVNEYSNARCGYRSFGDFEGVGVGYSYLNIGPGLESSGAFYSPGLTANGSFVYVLYTGGGGLPAGSSSSGYNIIGPSVRADRGLRGVHNASFCCRVDGVLTFAFVDTNGLIGSTIPTIDLDLIDADGRHIPYSRARSYGTLPGVITPYLWGKANQSQSDFAFYVLVSDVPPPNNTIIISNGAGGQYVETGVNMRVMRIGDAIVHSERRGGNVQLRSSVPQVAVTTRKPTGASLGTIREDGGESGYDVTAMLDYLGTNTGNDAVPNPNRSAGVSPVLRALLTQSGIPFSIVREVYNDGDPNGHQGGNALDIAGADTSLAVSQQTASEAQSAAMQALCNLLAQVPQLFSSVIHYDPEGGNSLFIWDGQLVTAKTYGGTSSQAVLGAVDNIHIASSKSRLLAALKNADVLTALGATPAQATDSSAYVKGRAQTDPFTRDNYVYTANDNYGLDGTVPLNAGNASIHGADFW